MHRATPLAQDEATSPRSPRPGTRPALVLIRCNPSTPPVPPVPATPAPALRLVAGEGHRSPSRTPSSVALQQFALAAERRRSSLTRFSAVAGRMAGQAEQLATALRTLRFTGSTA